MRNKTEYTYEMIEPLVVHAEPEGSRMFCEFSLPGSDEIFEATSSISRGRGTADMVKRTMKRSVTNQARRQASRMLRSALGGGSILGRVASQSFNQASRGATKGMVTGFSKEEKETAILDAFLKVAENFHYDTERGEWSKAAAPPPPKEKTPVEKQLSDNPITAGYDQQILARLLAELAYADGTISPEEQEFFKSIIPPNLGTIESLVQGDPVSRIECEEVTLGAKASIYMFAWVISLADFDLDPIENELLSEYGEMFGFNQDQVSDLTTKAKAFIMEKSIDPSISRQELFDLADKLGMGHDDAERCKIQMIKRMS